MSFSDKESQEYIVHTVDSDLNGDTLNVRGTNGVGCFGVKWTDATQTDATVQVQVSLDNVNWVNFGDPLTIDSASGAELIEISDYQSGRCVYPFIRLAVTANNETAAALVCGYYFKGHR